MKRIILLALLTLAAIAAHAQGEYYHQVGDTVRGKCPIYHYQNNWWSILDESTHADSIITTAFRASGYMKHTTNTPLRVIGVASTVARMYTQTDSPYEDFDASIDGAMYYVLLDATDSGLVEKARVCWTDDYMTHPKRYMELPIMTGLCSSLEDHTAIVSLREYYFDSVITVADSFYLGCVFPDGTASGLEDFLYFATHGWDYCAYSSMEANGTFKDCAKDMPEFTYYDSSRLDNSWHYITSKKFQLIFPIIELDTLCVTPEEPQVAYRDNLTVRVAWVDSSSTGWEVSRTAPDGDPDAGLITTTTVPYIEYTDINNDSIYHVYVRGYCENGIWSGWSDWSTPCVIDSLPTPTAGIYAVESAELTLYPNPATHQVIIESGETVSEAWLTDLTGRREQVRLIHQGHSSNNALTQSSNQIYSLDLTSTQTIKQSSNQAILLTIITASGKTHTIHLLKQSDIISR